MRIAVLALVWRVVVLLASIFMAWVISRKAWLGLRLDPCEGVFLALILLSVVLDNFTKMLTRLLEILR